ncbi:hypothetical protein HKX48_003431 [Thoreauomyces humboldtii]|nr:hypothetical protein HKX48_003431 [Thoreauomyces humboldtii]
MTDSTQTRHPTELRALSSAKLLVPDDLVAELPPEEGGDVSENAIPQWEEGDAIQLNRIERNIKNNSNHDVNDHDTKSHTSSSSSLVSPTGEHAQTHASGRSSPKMDRPAAYRPNAGPVTYKQLSFDDEHEDVLVHRMESDYALSSPSGDHASPQYWGGRDGPAPQGSWIFRKWRGLLQSICAAPIPDHDHDADH